MRHRLSVGHATAKAIRIRMTTFALLVLVIGSPRHALADAIVPDRALTPGSVLPVSLQTICHKGYAHRARLLLPIGSPKRAERRAQRLLKRSVYERYHMLERRGQHEVDHDLSLELGGSNNITNLWPQPYHAYWGAYQKDHLENRLHRLACDHQVPLAQVQFEITNDWIAAYKKYIGATPQGETGHYDPASFEH